MTDAPLDPVRARLIDSIYEAVLRPAHYDHFMNDWADHIEQAQARLGALRVSAGSERATLDDPVIEGHFRRAFAMLERMGRGPSAALPAAAADPDGPPVLLLRRLGAVRIPDPQPTAALFGARADLPAVLAALTPDSAQRLAAMAATLDRAPAVGAFALLALAEPAGADTPDARLLVARSQRSAEGEVEVALHPLRLGWSEAVATILAQSFGLTPRETELVQGLAQGADLAGLARQSGRSVHTLRAQIKSVFQKTHATSQLDLMRRVAALIRYAGPESVQPVAPAPDWGRMQMIPVADGRSLPVHLLGPEGGRPVVFVHGMLDGVAVTRRIGAELAAAGLRLIAPVRPNFGAASPDDRVREAPQVFARDLGAILQALAIDRAVLLGHMAGAVYTSAAAAHLDGRVAGVVQVAGGVPIRSVRQFSVMTRRQRTVALTARFAPALLPAILRAGIAQIDGKDADAFMAALYAPGTRDRQVVADPAIAAAIQDGYRFSVAQGEQAFRIDSWHVTRDWSALVAAGRCPVLLLHGARDPVVHVDTVRAFAQGSNRIRLEVLPKEGQLLFYSAPDRVLAEIAAFADRTRG